MFYATFVAWILLLKLGWSSKKLEQCLISYAVKSNCYINNTCSITIMQRH